MCKIDETVQRPAGGGTDEQPRVQDLLRIILGAEWGSEVWKKAMEELFLLLSPRLVYHARGDLGLTEEEAKDVVGDAWVRVLKRRWDPSKGDLVGWLYRVVRNRSLDTIKERRGFSLWTFSANDIQDLPAFAGKLKQPSRAIDVWLSAQLSFFTQEALAAYRGADSDPVLLQKALLADLKKLLSGASIYDKERFLDVVLRKETESLLHKPDEDPRRTNTMLLEDAYRLELANHKGKEPRIIISLEAEYGETADSDGVSLRDTLSTPSDEEAQLELESAKEIRRALELLDSRWTSYLLLNSLDGMTYGEIAKLMETTEKTAKGRCQMARKQLAAIIKRLREQEITHRSHQLRRLRMAGTKFFMGDLKDAPSLVAKLKAPTFGDDVSAFISDPILSGGGLLSKWKGTKVQADLQQSVIDRLNALIAGPLIGGPIMWKARRVALRPETRSLLDRNPNGDEGELFCLNRLLLEDAYPLELSRSWRLNDLHCQAWKVFLQNEFAVKEAMLHLNQERPAVIKLLREAFAVLTAN